MQEGAITGKCSDSQVLTNLSGTGEIATNFYDAEENAITDDQLFGFLNVTIIAITTTSGLTEGILLAVRTDDATDLATAKDGTSAGYVVIGGVEIPKEEVIAGRQFSVPYRKDVGKKYFSAWYKAVNTAHVGTITVDAEFSNAPVGLNETIQKVRTSV